MTRLCAVFSVLGLVVLAADCAAAEPAADPRVAAAIARGAAALQRLHGQPLQGVPGGGEPGGEHGGGAAALAGLAMLEGGIKPDDIAVQNIAKRTRATWTNDTKTYNVSLAILFLDRVGDAADIPTIQLLGTRLYGGMCRDGTYSYECADAVPINQAGKSDAELIAGAPGAKAEPKKPEPKKPDNGFPTAVNKKPNAPGVNPGKLHPSVAPYNAAVRATVLANGRLGGGGDNSNTQFGLIGLWVAARHGVPVDDAFVLLEAHFLTTQNATDAGWGYAGAISHSTTAMTCAGLLGLAIGTTRGQPAAAAPAPAAPAGDPDDPFNRTKAPKAGGSGVKPVGVNPLAPHISAAMRKAAIDNALKSVGAVIQSAQAGQMQLKQFVGLGDEYYTLWSIERVGMAYGLDTIGGIDWHQWGAGYLLPLQTEDGSWPQGTHGGVEVATSFAVLFLSKSNFVKDLTRMMGKVKDPGKAELRAGRDFKPPLVAPQASNPGAGSEPGVRPTEPVVPAGVAALADALVNGTDFAVKLQEARDTKGTEYTAALVKAIPRLTDERRALARDALAERLTRMTAKSLRTMLADPESELRRAAALACAMKDDKTHVPDLIDRVGDPADLVVQAARAGLKSLTGQDFGPPVGSDEDARKKAASAWNKWYLTDGKK